MIEGMKNLIEDLRKKNFGEKGNLEGLVLYLVLYFF